MNCTLKWCNLCKREAHKGSSCYKLIFKDAESDDMRIQIIDTMIQNSISKALTHTCSTCGAAYIKEEGCNLMMCSHCGGMSCYLCSAKIYYKEGRGKYWHFAGHEFSEPDSKCLTWNNTVNGVEKQGNTEFNNDKIIRELVLFIINNNEYISKSIYNRILFLYEKDDEFNFIVKKLKELNINDFRLIPRKYVV